MRNGRRAGVSIGSLFLEFEINELILLVIPGDIRPLGVKLWFKVGLLKSSLKLVSLLLDSSDVESSSDKGGAEGVESPWALAVVTLRAFTSVL